MDLFTIFRMVSERKRTEGDCLIFIFIYDNPGCTNLELNRELGDDYDISESLENLRSLGVIREDAGRFFAKC